MKKLFYLTIYITIFILLMSDSCNLEAGSNSSKNTIKSYGAHFLMTKL